MISAAANMLQMVHCGLLFGPWHKLCTTLHCFWVIGDVSITHPNSGRGFRRDCMSHCKVKLLVKFWCWIAGEIISQLINMNTYQNDSSAIAFVSSAVFYYIDFNSTNYVHLPFFLFLLFSFNF